MASPTEADGNIQEQIQQLSTAVVALALRQEEFINAQPQDNNNPIAELELPEFHGKQPAEEELIDWILIVQEALECKRVPLDRCVPVVTVKFRGVALAWWSKLKTTRARLGKPEIMSWDKLKRKMRKAFLPFNYDHMMLQRVYSLRQETLCVREYYAEFFRVSTRVDMQESEQQTVARYVGGLRTPIREYFKSLNPLTLSEAHQHALAAEAQANDYKSRSVMRMDILVIMAIGSTVLLLAV